LIQRRQGNLSSRFSPISRRTSNGQRHRVDDLKRFGREFSYRRSRSNCRPVGIAKDTNPRNYFGLALNAVEAAGLMFENPFPQDAEPHLAVRAAIVLNDLCGTDHQGQHAPEPSDYLRLFTRRLAGRFLRHDPEFPSISAFDCVGAGRFIEIALFFTSGQRKALSSQKTEMRAKCRQFRAARDGMTSRNASMAEDKSIRRPVLHATSFDHGLNLPP